MFFKLHRAMLMFNVYNWSNVLHFLTINYLSIYLSILKSYIVVYKLKLSLTQNMYLTFYLYQISPFNRKTLNASGIFSSVEK